MKDDTPSRTAAFVAATRSLGKWLPDDVRIADDPYGLAFATSPRLAALIERAPHGLAKIPGLREWIIHMQVRTRLLDDAARAVPGRQVVVLGAGYDCRSLRFPELGPTFEVDHPATQGHKRAVLAKLGVDSPSRFVTWNFEERPLEELADALAAAGHDRSKPTFTIWEGVTMYLTEPAIDASLRAIRGWSSPGSQLGMTYIERSRIAKPPLAARAIQAAVAGLGEPWRWGWDPAELPDYLSARGWEFDDDIGMLDAAHALMPAEFSPGREAASRHVALASRTERVAVSSPTAT